jgi:hypothetical protein
LSSLTWQVLKEPENSKIQIYGFSEEVGGFTFSQLGAGKASILVSLGKSFNLDLLGYHLI